MLLVFIFQHIDILIFMRTDEPNLREWMQEQSFSLALSSGFFAMSAHAGMLNVLEENGLLPQKIMGSSSGALVAGLWASGMDSGSIQYQVEILDRSAIWDPKLGAGILKGDLLKNILKDLVVEDAFELCRIPVSVSVFNLRKRQTEIVQNGSLTTAIRASSAFPLLFQPVQINGKPMLDGGIKDRLGIAGAIPEERLIIHSVVSSQAEKRALGGVLQASPLHTRIIRPRNLPRVTPFTLSRSREAFVRARDYTTRALDMPHTLFISNKPGL